MSGQEPQSDWVEANAMNDETWDPTTDKTVEGQYLSVKRDVGPNHSNVYTLKTPSGKSIGVWGSTVLDTKFAEIPRGCLVKIQYEGLVEGKGGKSYKDFKVFYKGAPFVEAGSSDLPPVDQLDEPLDLDL